MGRGAGAGGPARSDCALNRRSAFALFASALLTTALLAALFVGAGLDLGATARMLGGLRPGPIAAVVLLLALNTFLAGEKWRLIDRRLSAGGSEVMPRAMYFAFTAIGVGLGQLLPTPLALGFSRVIGAQFYGGRGLLRGGAATLGDQLFDIIVAGLVGLASVFVILTGGAAAMWLVCATAFAAAGFVLCGAAARWAARLSRALGPRLVRVASSGVLNPDLATRLFALSVLRFGLLALIADASAAAVPLDVPLWHLAAALPFAVFANALAVTPGGLGVNEWAVSSALFALGTQFAVAAQWAIVNRVVVASAALFGGLGGAVVLVLIRRTRPVAPA